MSQFLISCKESRIETNRSFYSSFIIGPFHPSESLTVATALRRSLLSELPGIGIVSVQIEGATHEYSNIPGVRDSVLDILLNLREIVLKKLSKNMRPQVGYLRARGPGTITAGDLCLPPFIQCIDRHQHIATLADDGVLNMKFIIAEGTNYIKGKPKLKIDINQFKKRRFILKKINQTCQTKMQPSYLENYYLYLKKYKNKKLFRSNVFLNTENKIESLKKKETNLHPGTQGTPPEGGKGVKKGSSIIKKNSLNLNLLNVDAVFNPITNVNYTIEVNEHKVLEQLFEKTNKIQSRLEITQTQPILMNSESLFLTPKILNKSNVTLEKENLEKKLIKAKPFLLSNQNFQENKGESLNSLKKFLQYQINLERFRYLTNKKWIATKINLKNSSKRNKTETKLFNQGFNYEGSIQPVLKSSNVDILPILTTSKSIKQLKKKQEKILTQFYNTYSFSETGTPLNEMESNIHLWSNSSKKDNVFHNNIILEVWTNGSLHPREAVYEALTYLIKLFAKLRKIKLIEPLSQFEASNIDFLTELKNNSNPLFPLNQTNFLGKYTTITSDSLNLETSIKEKIKIQKKTETKKMKENKKLLTNKKDTDPINNISKQKLKSLDISSLKIALRPLMALKKKNINTIGELIKFKKEDLLGIPYIGEKSIAEIEKSLLDFGLCLKQ